VAESQLIWYRSPAERWFWGMPVGNGRIGAVVWGGIEVERIRTALPALRPS